MKLQIFPLAILLLTFLACGGPEPNPSEEETQGGVDMMSPMEFSAHRVVDSATWWWALTIADVTNDSIQDIIYIHNNAQGGYLAYRAGKQSPGIWEETIVAEAPPTGGTFAAGDLEAGDMDGDGNPLGILFTLSTDTAGAASITITLRHEPKKPNDGTLADAGGETDIAETFNLTIQ